MPFPPAKDHKISLEQATATTRRHQASNPNAIRAGMFPRSCFEALMKQPGCEGIRIYYGRDEKSQPSLVMVGVDSDGNDMTDGDLIDNNFPCPPFCTSEGGALGGQ